MNLEGVIRRVQSIFGDEDEALVKVEDIVDWANEAQDRIARETEILQDQVNLTPEIGEERYLLPDNFIRAKRVTYDGHTLDLTTLEEMDLVLPNRDNDDSSGAPLFFWVWGPYMYFWPAPSVATVDIIKVFYVKTAGILSQNTDESQLPTRMHNEIVRFCLMRAKELDQDDVKAAEISQSLSYEIGQGKEEKSGVNANSYPAVRQVDADWW